MDEKTGGLPLARKDRGVVIRTNIMLIAVGILMFVPLILKLYDLQIVRHEELQEKALRQQTSDQVFTGTRGTIYDRNMQTLAISAGVTDVFADPSKISKDERRRVAVQAADLLGLDADDLEEKLTRNSGRMSLTLKTKLEQAEAETVREYILKNGLEKKIFLKPGTKRYYPYSNFASNLLGFTGDDGIGVEGLEHKYDAELTGTPKRIIKSNNQGAAGQYEQYIDGEAGQSLVLTLDQTIQHFLEKHLADAVTENLVANRAIGIVMDVSTGGILAMATSPSYDPNDRKEVYDPAARALLAGLPEEDQAAKKAELLLAQYRNKAVADAYEPGSTFKIITAAIALEEKVVSMTDRFNCGGSIMVKGWNKPINCHKRTGHGGQDFLQGIQNSCNPVFITVGLRIGHQLFWDYLHAFGFYEKTGIDIPGETNNTTHSYEDMKKDVTIATTAFGQSFTVTPLQLITAASAVANGGKLMWPHVASAFLDAQDNLIKSVEPKVVRQVISEETAQQVCAALEAVVTSGTGHNAYVKGYRVGGKTGTAQKRDSTGATVTGRYVVSFLGFAPADNPQIALLVAMDEPMKGENANMRSGGQMAAPLAGKIMADILPYVGIAKHYTDDELKKMEIPMPKITGLDLDAAKKLLTNSDFKYKIVGGGDTVLDQIPLPDVNIPRESEVIIYTDTLRPTDLRTVPNVVGMSPQQANKAITDAGFYMATSGTDKRTTTIIAGSQDIAAGEEREPGTVVNVQFIDTSIGDQTDYR